MKILLDSEVRLFVQVHPERFGHHTLTLLADERNRLLLSGASSWDVALKFHTGRMQLPNPPDAYIPGRMLASGVDGLAVEHSHALGVPRLDDHHSDPFDRLLVSQAMLEKLPIVFTDPALSAYEIEWIDATK